MRKNTPGSGYDKGKISPETFGIPINVLRLFIIKDLYLFIIHKINKKFGMFLFTSDFSLKI